MPNESEKMRWVVIEGAVKKVYTLINIDTSHLSRLFLNNQKTEPFLILSKIEHDWKID